MQLRKTLMRTAGAVLVTIAVAPWLGAGSAFAAAADDSDCSTRPDSVPASATCVVLDENTGNDPALHGETWAWRDANNDLHVSAFPTAALDGSDAVQLCIQDSGPFSADFKCLGSSPQRVYVGGDLVLVVDLDTNGITPAESVYYSIHVNQGGRTTVSSGNGGSVPPPPVDVCSNLAGDQATVPAGFVRNADGTCTQPPVDVCSNIAGNQATVPAGYTRNADGTCTPTPAPATSSAAAPPASNPVSSPRTSVLPTKVSKPSTSVEGVKVPRTLPHTGAGPSALGLVAVSLGLLLVGGALLAAPSLAVERGEKRRH